MPQPLEADQFGAMQQAPLGTPHGYERVASLQDEIKLSSGPTAEEIASEVYRLPTSRAEPTLSGFDDKAPRAKYAAGGAHEDAITMNSITEGIAVSFSSDGDVTGHGDPAGPGRLKRFVFSGPPQKMLRPGAPGYGSTGGIYIRTCIGHGTVWKPRPQVRFGGGSNITLRPHAFLSFSRHEPMTRSS